MEKKHIQTKYIDRLYKKMMTDETHANNILHVVCGKNQPTEIVIANATNGQIHLSIMDKNQDLNQLADEALSLL